MLATHVVPWTSAPRVASARTTRAERHGAWKRPGGTDGWCGGHEKARLYGRSVTRVSAPDARGGASMENHVQFLLSLTRRAALVATVSGLCLGPALASESEEEASPDQEPSTSDSIAEQPSVVAADSTSTPPSGSPLDDPWEGSYVKPALTVSQYVEEVRVSHAECPPALFARNVNLDFANTPYHFFSPIVDHGEPRGSVWRAAVSCGFHEIQPAG
jgi:hypothetical protein